MFTRFCIQIFNVLISTLRVDMSIWKMREEMKTYLTTNNRKKNAKCLNLPRHLWRLNTGLVVFTFWMNQVRLLDKIQTSLPTAWHISGSKASLWMIKMTHILRILQIKCHIWWMLWIENNKESLPQKNWTTYTTPVRL